MSAVVQSPSSSSESPAQVQAGVGKGVYRQFVIGKTALHGAQYASLAASPAYLVYAWSKHRFSLRALVRANWMVPLTGSLLAGVYAAQETNASSGQVTFAQAQAMRMNAADIKSEDYFVIGGVVGALLVPAIFLKRVGVVNGILGGLGMGGGAGLVYDWVEEALQKNNPPALAPQSELVKVADTVAPPASEPTLSPAPDT